MKSYHEELSRKVWSMWQRHITQKHCLADSRIIYFWYVLKSISINSSLNSMPCSAYLQWGLIKTKRRGRIISNFSKGEIYDKTSYLMTTKYSWGLSHNASPLLAPLKRSLPLPFSLGKKRIYLDTQLKGELADLF